MHVSPPLQTVDHLGPALAALVFITLMSLVKEPARRQLNAIIVAGACGTYLSGGFGPAELLYPLLATGVVYLGLRSHRFIGVAWLMHAGWDLLHHRYGNPIWPFMPTSSWGCMVFDSVLAVWFLAGAPSVLSFLWNRLSGCSWLKVSSAEKDLPMLVRTGAVLLDVRTDREFSSGHLPGAINLPLGRIREEYVQLDPSKTYIAYCSHGLRSRRVVSILEERGLRHVVNGGPMSELEEALREESLISGQER